MAKKKGRRGGKRDDDGRSGHISREDMQNARFEKYYRAQNILEDAEWEEFSESMRQVLPVTFRVAGSRQTAQVLNDTIKKTHTPQLAKIEFEGQVLAPPVQLPWYPDGLAWQLNVSKAALRKSPELKKFHSFLVFETEVGNISRQEAVSMIPPLLLDVEPHHKVIDMCAAPGSKTAQLLEALHANDTLTSSSTPLGLLIANDSDNKRAHMLIHQSARLPSPSLLVTNVDASIYPAMKIPQEVSGSATGVGGPRLETIQFDRILCDVPCSGDGTMRKNPAIWKRWSPMDGNGLHSLQLRILQRSMRMLKPGGRIVYSTCSLNPVENEAVVAAALKSITDFELVDVSDRLPGLARRPGLRTWQPSPSREVGALFPSFAAYNDSLSDSNRAQSKMTPGQWPPEDVDTLHLERCLRIYPHLQDTGGFFVAVLHKKEKPLERSASKRQADNAAEPSGSKKARTELSDDAPTQDITQVANIDGAVDVAQSMAVDDGTPDAGAAPRLVSPVPSSKEVKPRGQSQSTPGGGSYKESPYNLLAPDDPNVLTCMDNLHLTPSFPSSHLLARNRSDEPVRALYLTNGVGAALLAHNDPARLRLLACGTKLFVKQGPNVGDGREAFRVLGDGLPVVLPYIKQETVLDGSLQALRILTEAYYPLCSAFPETFRNTMEPKSNGSYVVKFPPEETDGASITHDLYLPVWKSNVSLCLMIEKKAKSALSLRVFGSDITTAGQQAAEKKRVAQVTQTEDVNVEEADAHISSPDDGDEALVDNV